MCADSDPSDSDSSPASDTDDGEPMPYLRSATRHNHLVPTPSIPSNVPHVQTPQSVRTVSSENSATPPLEVHNSPSPVVLRRSYRERRPVDRYGDSITFQQSTSDQVYWV